MPLGDDALAAGMDIVDPDLDDRREGANEITKTRDYIAQFNDVLEEWATDTFVPKSEAAAAGSSEANKLVRYDASGRIVTPLPTAGNHAAAKLYVDNAINGIDLSNYVAKTGNHTMSGNLVVNGNVFVPNATAAVSGYTIAYINSDGRLSEGASTERVKHDIDRDPEIPDVFAVPIASFVMNADPTETTRFGPIAEDLAGNDATVGFVVYDSDGLPKSFDQISYLMAAVAQLHATVVAQAARIEALEAKHG